jgi:hypothetical protein
MDFVSRYCISCKNTALSKTLLKMVNRATGRNFFRSIVSPYFRRGTTSALFQDVGKEALLIDYILGIAGKTRSTSMVSKPFVFEVFVVK